MRKTIKFASLIIFCIIVIVFFIITLRNCNKIVLKPEPYINTLKLNNLGIVMLDENPSTGYTWHYQIEKSKILKFESGYVFIPKSRSIGQGAKHIWKFKPLNIGSTKIKFEYYREWEKDNVAKKVEYLVKVIK